MLENGDESHLSSAPMMMASDHFIQENGDLRSENAVLDGDFTHDGLPGIRLLISPGIVHR